MRGNVNHRDGRKDAKLRHRGMRRHLLWLVGLGLALLVGSGGLAGITNPWNMGSLSLKNWLSPIGTIQSGGLYRDGNAAAEGYVSEAFQARVQPGIPGRGDQLELEYQWQEDSGNWTTWSTLSCSATTKTGTGELECTVASMPKGGGHYNVQARVSDTKNGGKKESTPWLRLASSYWAKSNPGAPQLITPAPGQAWQPTEDDKPTITADRAARDSSRSLRMLAEYTVDGTPRTVCDTDSPSDNRYTCTATTGLIRGSGNATLSVKFVDASMPAGLQESTPTTKSFTIKPKGPVAPGKPTLIVDKPTSTWGDTVTFTATADAQDKNRNLKYTLYYRENSSNKKCDEASSDAGSQNLKLCTHDNKNNTYKYFVVVEDSVNTALRTESEELEITINKAYAPETPKFTVHKKKVKWGENMSFTVTTADADKNRNLTYVIQAKINGDWKDCTSDTNSNGSYTGGGCAHPNMSQTYTYRGLVKDPTTGLKNVSSWSTAELVREGKSQLISPKNAKFDTDYTFKITNPGNPKAQIIVFYWDGDRPKTLRRACETDYATTSTLSCRGLVPNTYRENGETITTGEVNVSLFVDGSNTAVDSVTVNMSNAQAETDTNDDLTKLGEEKRGRAPAAQEVGSPADKANVPAGRDVRVVSPRVATNNDLPLAFEVQQTSTSDVAGERWKTLCAESATRGDLGCSVRFDEAGPVKLRTVVTNTNSVKTATSRNEHVVEVESPPQPPAAAPSVDATAGGQVTWDGLRPSVAPETGSLRLTNQADIAAEVRLRPWLAHAGEAGDPGALPDASRQAGDAVRWDWSGCADCRVDADGSAVLRLAPKQQRLVPVGMIVSEQVPPSVAGTAGAVRVQVSTVGGSTDVVELGQYRFAPPPTPVAPNTSTVDKRAGADAVEPGTVVSAPSSAAPTTQSSEPPSQVSPETTRSSSTTQVPSPASGSAQSGTASMPQSFQAPASAART